MGKQLKLAQLALLISIRAHGAVYYVDAVAGSDANQGISPSAPWKTIWKVNGTALMPGDSVLFHRGQTWREQLTVSRSGAAGSPITYDSYGLGKKPTIAGSDLIGQWTSADANIFIATSYLQPYNLYADNGDALIAVGSVEAVRKLAGSWYWDSSGKLYASLSDGTSPGNHLMEAATRPFGIYAANSRYIAVSNLEIKQTSQSGIYATSKDSASPTEYWNISRCTIRNVREAGIYVLPSGAAGQPMLQGWVIRNNTIGRIDGSAALNYDSAGLLIRGTNKAVIAGNAVATVNRLGIRMADYFGATPSNGAIVDGNVLGMNQGNISIAFTSNASITNNYISNSKGYGIGIGGKTSTNATVTENVITNLAISDDQQLYNGLDCNDGATGGLFSYNTVVGVTNYSMTLEGDNGQLCSDWVVTNNILDARANIPHPYARGIAGAFYTVVPISNISFSGNNYLASGNSPSAVVRYLGTDYGFGRWKNLAQEPDAISSDPLFMNASGGDLSLQTSSPCKMAADNGGCGRYIY